MAAILIYFLSVAVLIQRGQHISDATPGGCARGVSAERFETPLAGGAAAPAAAWGEPAGPGLPLGETGKGRSNSLPQAIVSITDLHVPVNELLYESPSKIRFPKFPSSTHVPRFYPHSDGPLLGPVHVEIRFQAQTRHVGDRPGLLGGCYLANDL